MTDDEFFEDLILNAEDGETVVVPPKPNAEPYLISRVIDVWRPLTIDFNGQTMLFEYEDGERTCVDGVVVEEDCVGGEWVDGIAKGFRIAVRPHPDDTDPEPEPYTTYFDRVVFKNGIFLGAQEDIWKNHLSPVLGSVSHPAMEIGLFQIDSCVFKDLTYGCQFNCENGGIIRSAVLSNCLFDNIIQKPGEGEPGDPENDIYRGKGAAFSFRAQEEMLSENEPIDAMSGISYGNVFKDCVRHGLYVSVGGPFLSMGDKFFNHSKDIVPSQRVAALALSRGGQMKVIGAYFQDCFYGINASPAKYGDVRELRGLSIQDCTFVDTKAAETTKGTDIILNAGAPDVNGVFTNVVVENTKHINRKQNTASQITVEAFRHMVLRNIDIELDFRETGPPAGNPERIVILAYGSCNPYTSDPYAVCGPSENPGDDDVKNDDLIIDGVTARFIPEPEAQAAHARVVILHPNVYEAEKTSVENHQPRVTIRKIDTNGTPVALSTLGGQESGVVTNPNLRWSWS